MTVYTPASTLYHIGDKTSWQYYRGQHLLIEWNKHPVQIVERIIEGWDHQEPLIISVATHLSAEDVHGLIKGIFEDKGFDTEVPPLNSDDIIVNNNN